MHIGKSNSNFEKTKQVSHVIFKNIDLAGCFRFPSSSWVALNYIRIFLC